MNSEKTQKIIDEIKVYKIYSKDDIFIINSKVVIFTVITNNRDYFNEYVDTLLKNENVKKQYLSTFESLFIMIIDNTLFLLPKNDYYSKLEMCVVLN